MHKLSPTLGEIQDLRKIVPPGPIVMINLMKFIPGSAHEFLIYMDAARRCFPEGAQSLYAGKCGPDLGEDDDWDYVGIMGYPSFDVFADFITSETYQNEALPARAKALERTVFMISQPSTLDHVVATTP